MPKQLLAQLVQKEEIIRTIKEQKNMIFYIETAKDENQEKIIKERISSITFYNSLKNEVCTFFLKEEQEIKDFKEVLEDENIGKESNHLSQIFILLKQLDIELKGIKYDAKIAGYILNPTDNKLRLEDLVEQYTGMNVIDYIGEEKQEQLPPEQEGQTDNEVEEITPPQEESTENEIENKVPEKLPKTGINIYIPICLVLIAVLTMIVYYNRKSSKK